MDPQAAPIPDKPKNLRACLLCSIIMTQNDFRKMGCPNCEELVGMQGSQERVAECTSAQYDGVIALINSEESWVGRWQRIAPFVKGLYAVRVTGRIPLELQDELRERGITYRPRDQIQDGD